MPASPTSFHGSKLCLDIDLHDAALIKRIRDAPQRGQPLGDEAFVQWAREQSMARKATPPAEPPETVINLEMAATYGKKEAILTKSVSVPRSLTPFATHLPPFAHLPCACSPRRSTPPARANSRERRTAPPAKRKKRRSSDRIERRFPFAGAACYCAQPNTICASPMRLNNASACATGMRLPRLRCTSLTIPDNWLHAAPRLPRSPFTPGKLS